MIYIPPGGTAGWAQMTPASKAAQAGGRIGGSTRRRGAKRAKAAKSTKRKARKTTNRKLKFGSPAWRKKYMKKRR